MADHFVRTVPMLLIMDCAGQAACASYDKAFLVWVNQEVADMPNYRENQAAQVTNQQWMYCTEITWG
jgi:hypothetical protein